MLTDVTILRQAEDFQFEAGGRAVKGIKTLFTVGRDGPFSVFLSDAEFTAKGNLALIEQKADAVRETRGHTDLRAT